MKHKLSLCWIRRDLRLVDHRALAEATTHSEMVALVFIFDTEILEGLSPDDRRVTFIHDSLKEIDRELALRKSRLIVLKGRADQEIPQLAHQLSADAVYCNHDYEPQTKLRDEKVRTELGRMGIEFLTYKDHVIFERRELLTQNGEPFRVFTAYKNTWLRKLTPAMLQACDPDYTKLAPKEKIANAGLQDWDLKTIGFNRAHLWLEAGPQGARARLIQFEPKLHDYKRYRDIPSADGTSGLSVHLRFGTLSVRECVRRATIKKSEGARTWLGELIWRDFYHMILDCFPHVVGHAFKREYESIHWPGSDAHFQLWAKGQTGYPLIDAAMRHLNQTGWMHNRLRMVVATFLIKDLLVDWRKGEAYFAEHLLDYDLAANNGGWQWCASLGCDAQPYFRIFNPITQSEKFDPNGTFIRENVPELRAVSDKKIHWPHDGAQIALASQDPAYPEPIVDHGVQRERALDLFQKNKKS